MIALEITPEIPYQAEVRYAFEVCLSCRGLITNMDVTLFEYLGLNGDKAWRLTERILNEAKDLGGYASLLWHNKFFGSKRFAHWETVYRKAIEWAVRQNAWIPTGVALTQWWLTCQAVQLKLAGSPREGWRLTLSHPQGIEGLALWIHTAEGEHLFQVGEVKAGQDRVISLRDVMVGSR